MSSFGWTPQYPIPFGNSPGFTYSDLLETFGARVTFGGIEFEAEYQRPKDLDVTYTLRSLSGWWEPAPESTQTMDHPSGDGLIELTPRLASRTITLEGLIIAGTPKAPLLIDAQNALSRIRTGTISVDERKSGLRREADVRRVDLQFARPNVNVAQYSLTLRASDPLRYSGSQVLTNGSNALVSRGDVDAFPVIDLRGPHGALTISHPGGSFSFPALSGGSRSIDCRNGDVWNGNVRVFAGSGAWPVVRSGGSNWTVSGLGSGSATVRRFEAWS